MKEMIAVAAYNIISGVNVVAIVPVFRYIIIRGDAMRSVPPTNNMLIIISKRNVDKPRSLFLLNFVFIFGLQVIAVSMNMKENTLLM